MGTPTQVLTLAGTGQDTFSEGIVTQSSFNWPWKPICLRNGDIVLTDRLNNRIRRVTVDQRVEVEAGSGEKSGADGLALRAGFNDPSYLFKGENDDIYITEGHGSRLRLLRGGQVTTVAGDGSKGYRDGPALQAQFAIILGGCRLPTGEIYLADNENNRVRVVEKDKMVTSIGTGTAASTDGPKETAAFNQPIGMAIDPCGEVFLSERYRIRHIDKNRRVITYAGTTQGDRDGPKESAQFNNVRDLLFAPNGELFISDSNNHKLKRIDQLGIVTTISGHKDGWKDGPLLAARFHRPAGLCFNLQGGLLIADCDNARLRIIPEMIHVSSSAPTAAIDLSDLLLPNENLPEHLSSYHHNASNSNFSVHSAYLLLVFPKLLEKGLLKLASSNVSYNTIQNFLTLIYSGTIPEVGYLELIEIFYLAQACDLPPEFSLAVRKKMFMMMGTLDADALIRAIFHVQAMCESLAGLVDMLVRALKPLFEPGMMSQITPLVRIDEPYGIKVLTGLFSQPAPPVDVKPLETTTEGYIANRLEVLYWSTLAANGEISESALSSPIAKLLMPLPKELEPDFKILVPTRGSNGSRISSSSPAPESDVDANVPARTNGKDAPGSNHISNNAEGANSLSSGASNEDSFELIPCHSWVLYGRWPYFKRLIDSGLTEAKTRTMSFPEATWGASTVRAFVRYLYTNNIGLFEGSDGGARLELLEHAGLFDLVDFDGNPTPAFVPLIEHCRSPLTLNVTPKTSISAYKRLLTYGSSAQRQELIKFMADNIVQIMNDDSLRIEFLSLGDQTIATVMFASHHKDYNERTPVAAAATTELKSVPSSSTSENAAKSKRPRPLPSFDGALNSSNTKVSK